MNSAGNPHRNHPAPCLWISADRLCVRSTPVSTDCSRQNEADNWEGPYVHHKPIPRGNYSDSLDSQNSSVKSLLYTFHPSPHIDSQWIGYTLTYADIHEQKQIKLGRQYQSQPACPYQEDACAKSRAIAYHLCPTVWKRME